MCKTTRNNWIAFLLVILFFFLAAALGGCGSVSVEKFADGSYKAESRSLFKDIKDVHIMKTPNGDVQASMGSSMNTDQANALFLVCTINPALPMCQQAQ